MASAKEREQFIAQLTRALPEQPAHVVADVARKIMRHAKTHGRLAMESCNGHPIQEQCPPKGCDMPAYNKRVRELQDRWGARIELGEQRMERLITIACEQVGLKPDFGGDPRGYTVKVHLATGAYNTMGGRESGYGVPQ